MNIKCILLFCLLGLSFIGKSQIISRDTVCMGEPVSFSANASMKHIQYCWEFGTSSLTPVLTTSKSVPGTGTNGNAFSVVAQATMIYDTADKKYYAFATSASAGYLTPSVQRLNFGTNPHGTPTVTDLGNPSSVLINSTIKGNSNMEAVELVKDNQGVFHMFICNGGIVHWVFGNGISNAPTQVSRIYDNTAVLGMPMQLCVIYYQGEWILFAGQTYGQATIVRFDLGTDLNSIPATIPTTSLNTGVSAPSYFAIIQQAGDWYMFFTNLQGTSTPLQRFSFGANLKNNTPALTNLGTVTPAIINCRGFNFIKSCDTFFMLGLNQDGTILSFNFHNNITSTPTAQSLGQVYGSGVNMQVLKPYWYNDTLWAISGNWNNNVVSTVYRFPLLGIPSGNAVIKYWDPATTYTFNTPGVYNVTLYCDQADPRGPQSYCKQIVVQPFRTDFLGPDTLLCGVPSYTLDAGLAGASGWLWNTGATTPSIAVTQSGRYNVSAHIGACPALDTVNVTFRDNPVVNLGPDQNVCIKNPLVLKPIGGNFNNPAYIWSTGATTAQIQVASSGSYILTVDDGGCKGADTVDIQVFQTPVVNLGNDTGICTSALPFILTPQDIPPAGSIYKWSNGLSQPQMEITRGGKYWLEVTLAQCVGSDTIVVNAIDDPDIDLGPDSIICEQSLANIGTEVFGATYKWSTGATTPYIDVSATGDYSLNVNLNGCAVQDTINITVMPLPNVNLGEDHDICEGQSIPLNATAPNGVAYQWNTGATTPIYNATKAGTYWAAVISEYGCRSSDTIILKPFAKPTVILGNDTVVCEETPLTIRPIYSINEDAIAWSNGSADRQIEITEGGTFIVSATNKCGTVSDTIDVRQIFCDIWIPNAFTPNGDGVNDVLKILGNIGRLQDVTFSIYNRWGEMVFNTHDKYYGWNGKQDGEDASLSVYVYVLQFSLDGKPHMMKGNVTLLR